MTDPCPISDMDLRNDVSARGGEMGAGKKPSSDCRDPSLECPITVLTVANSCGSTGTGYIQPGVGGLNSCCVLTCPCGTKKTPPTFAETRAGRVLFLPSDEKLFELTKRCLGDFSSVMGASLASCPLASFGNDTPGSRDLSLRMALLRVGFDLVHFTALTNPLKWTDHDVGGAGDAVGFSSGTGGDEGIEGNGFCESGRDMRFCEGLFVMLEDGKTT